MAEDTQQTQLKQDKIVFPSFTIADITKRCAQDIEKFKTENKVANDTTGLKLTENIDTKEVAGLRENVDKIVLYIKTTIETAIPDKSYKYVDAIPKIADENVKQQLWIARTYLFYEILLLATVLLSNETKYNEFFKEFNFMGNAYSSKYPFRNDIADLLSSFNMAIFGSMKTTSDIDLGVQYSGKIDTIKNDIYKGGLDYIVATIETLYVKLADKDQGSLAYDIESYAAMVTLPNNGNDSATNPYYFYLDSSKFSNDDFNVVLKCAYDSISRNVILAYKDTTEEDKQNDIKSKLDSLTLSDIINTLQEKITLKHPINYTPSQSYQSINQLDEPTKNIFNTTDGENIFNRSKTEMFEFLEMNYENQRYKYYEKVRSAENAIITAIKNVNGEIKNLDSSTIANITRLIGESDAYRMESYTCVPTVVHVVRIFQASDLDKELKQKYITFYPKTMCNGTIQDLFEPKCTIGPYGYVLSILEQIGYLYRFYLTYCTKDSHNNTEESHIENDKCTAKKDKYLKRYNDAFQQLSRLNEEEPKKGGRNKSKTHKRKYKHKKTRKTKKNARTRKLKMS